MWFCIRLAVGFVVLSGCFAAGAIGEPTITWQPISSSGPFTIIGNKIIIPDGGSGIEVYLEMRLSGWGSAPGSPELGAYQGTVESDGYDNGAGEPLNPKGWPTTPEDGAFINDTRENYVFFGMSSLPVWSTISLDYEWGSVLVSSTKPDDGETYYGATLILEIPAGAGGTYTIDWNPSPTKTFLNTVGGPIPGLVRVPGVIEIPTGKCCYSYPWYPLCADGITESTCAELAHPAQYYFFEDMSCAGTVDCSMVCNWHPEYCWWEGDSCWEADCDYDTGDCKYLALFDVETECCDSRTGETTPLDDGNDCTYGICEQWCKYNWWEPCETHGDCSEPYDHCDILGTLYLPMPEGTACDPGDDCVLDPSCNDSGTCVGDLPEDLNISCAGDGDCPTAWFCNLETELCDCLSTPHEARKNRYVSFTPDSGGESVAFDITMTASTYFSDSTGPLGWVGEPDGNNVSRVVADAFFTDAWPEVVHVGDCRIVPAATYELRSTPDGVTFGDPEEVGTIIEPAPKKWGDVVGPFSGTRWDPPDREVNMDDVMAAVQCFKELPQAPHWTWIDVDEQTPNAVVNFTDIMRIVQGFKGEPYPFADPADCP